jgi:hypothetical protein
MRGTLVMVGACAVMVGPSLSPAQQRGNRTRVRTVQQRMSGQQRWWTNEARAKELGLSDQQVADLEEMADLGLEEVQPARQRYFRAYRAFLTALTEYDPDSQEVTDAKAEVVDAWDEMTSVSVDQMIEMRRILSADQWQRLPEVVPRALRIGNLSLRGHGAITAEPSDGGS